MKHLKTFFIAVVLTLGATTFTNAQSKIAHIASQELIEQMPAYTDAMNQLEKLRKTYDTEIKDMVTEAQATMKRYETEAGTKTDEENRERMMELQQTQQAVAQFRQNAMKELQQKEIELLKPVYEKARTAIQKVAREKGYEYVFDSTTGTGLILADGYNLMDDVKAELGL